MLKLEKKIVLGITGSIAAYKCVSLARLLVKSGAEVKVILTSAGSEFVSPLSLSTMTKNPVIMDMTENNTWINHVDIGLWADLMIVAPCSANTLAKMANGLCDNMLTAVYLSAKCPVMVSPAMDLDMWKHPSTQRNVKLLESYGNIVIPPGSGELASGLVGEGRMPEPENILKFIESYFSH